MDRLYHELLEKINISWTGLPDKPEETPETTLKALWHLAAGNCVTAIQARDLPLPQLTDEMHRSLEALIDRRKQGTPLAYMTGRQTFMGITMLSGPEAMIPRVETEILGKAAIESAQQLAKEHGTIRVIDVCTGSGNIALAMAHNEPGAQIWAADISPEAVELAKRNASFLGYSDRVLFFQGDLLGPLTTPEFAASIDMITCNPPYISSVQVDRMPDEIHLYEPRFAFDGGPFGIQIMSRLIREAPFFLKPGSILCFEIGLGQGKNMLYMIKKAGVYQDVETISDEKGEVRVIRARYQPAE